MQVLNSLPCCVPLGGRQHLAGGQVDADAMRTSWVRLLARARRPNCRAIGEQLPQFLDLGLELLLPNVVLLAEQHARGGRAFSRNCAPTMLSLCRFAPPWT
jgi:hypothetical protein